MITLSWSFLVEGFDCCHKIGCWTNRDATAFQIDFGHFKECIAVNPLVFELLSISEENASNSESPTNNFIDRPTFDWLLFIGFC